MKYNVTHLTRYQYAGQASLSHNEIYLAPRNTPVQTCTSNTISLSPSASTMSRRTDYFGNQVISATIQSSHRELAISAASCVEIGPVSPSIPAEQTPAWEQARQVLWQHQDPDNLDAFQFAFSSPMVQTADRYARWAGDVFRPGTPILKAAMALTEKIYTEFKYDPEATTTATSVEKAFNIRRGVCQDFAHIQIACLRSLGLAARYVSGYLNTIPPRGTEKLVGADASHAWLSVYIPGTGWVDLDPTNNLIPTDQHLTVAWGRDYSDVTPVKGTVLGGGEHRLSVSVDVSLT